MAETRCQWGVLYEDGVEPQSDEHIARKLALVAPYPIAEVVRRETSASKWSIAPEPTTTRAADAYAGAVADELGVPDPYADNPTPAPQPAGEGRTPREVALTISAPLPSMDGAFRPFSAVVGPPMTDDTVEIQRACGNAVVHARLLPSAPGEDAGARDDAEIRREVLDVLRELRAQFRMVATGETPEEDSRELSYFQVQQAIVGGEANFEKAHGLLIAKGFGPLAGPVVEVPDAPF